MKDCLAEGTLRAYHDSELPADEMGRVAAHLAECSACETLADEVAGRAMRVQGLLSALPGPEQVIWMPRVAPRSARTWPRWVAAAAAIAAGVAIVLSWPGKAPEKAVLQPPAVQEQRPNLDEAEPVAAQVHPPAVQLAANRSMRKQAASRKPLRQVFLALDDEPIETGIVIRVALGDTGVPADVVFGTDGRARAIRLVDSKH